MHALARFFAALAIGLLGAGALGEELRIPVGTQHGADAAPLPPRGMPMARVRAGWGEPAATHEAVGQPPITRWDYRNFSVYFEHDHVVHAVVRHQRADAPPTQDREP